VHDLFPREKPAGRVRAHGEGGAGGAHFVIACRRGVCKRPGVWLTIKKRFRFPHAFSHPTPMPARRLIPASLAAAVAFAAILSVARASDPPQSVRVAGVVLKWIRGDKEANFRRAQPLVRQAARGGAKIVCTTECFLDGYAIADKSIPLDTYRALGEPIPDGPYYTRLARLADELDIHLVAGMLEADRALRYNAAVVIDPEGRLTGKYRKQKLGHELARNTPGRESSVFDTPYGKLGVMICADRTEPDIVRGFCANGADFLICPSGGMFGPEKNDPIVSARSRENNIYITFVHPAEFLVTAPGGRIVIAELFGDLLLIDPRHGGSATDSGGVRYFDLPVAKRAR